MAAPEGSYPALIVVILPSVISRTMSAQSKDWVKTPVSPVHQMRLTTPKQHDIFPQWKYIMAKNNDSCWRATAVN
jgi:hypothetical protein